MFQLIYNIGIYVLGLGMYIASFFNPKAKKWILGRQNWEEKLTQFVTSNSKPIIWMHCSSLGEFEQGRPVLEALRDKYPGKSIILSFFSPSGYEVRKNYPLADYVFYLPLDTPKNAKKLAQIINPELLILVKYEFWMNLISEIHKNKNRQVVISAIFRSNQIYFKPIGYWFRKKISQINYFFLQDKNSYDLLNFIPKNKKMISGDTRFDTVYNNSIHKKPIPEIEKFKNNKLILIVGSAWNHDLDILKHFINHHWDKNSKIIIAPHEINASQIQNFIAGLDSPAILWSEFNQYKGENILIIDTVGLLSRVYQYSDVAWIGGGFNKTGVHNVLEPACFDNAIIFGPNYTSYIEAVDLLKNKAGISVKNKDEMINKLNLLLSQPIPREELSENAHHFIMKNKGSTSSVINHGIIND